MDNNQILIGRDKFYLMMEGKECFLSFRSIGEGVLEFYKTFVPKELRGRGIAARLVEFGLSYASERNLSVKPTCSYVKSYIDRHEKWHWIVKG